MESCTVYRFADTVAEPSLILSLTVADSFADTVAVPFADTVTDPFTDNISHWFADTVVDPLTNAVAVINLLADAAVFFTNAVTDAVAKTSVGANIIAADRLSSHITYRQQTH